VSDYAWIVLTSVNGVDTLFERMHQSSQDARNLHGVRLCAISSRAAEALRDRALTPDLAPERYESEFVGGEMERVGGSLRGSRVLIPRAEIGRVALLEELRKRGAHVDPLDAYIAAIPADTNQLVDDLERFAPEYVIFNSGSAARNFAQILGPERTRRLAESVTIAAIGPMAARAAGESGLPAGIVPQTHRIPDLVDAIAAHDARR
jgi:uroporphyrinogen III methyltransferase/synthase